MSILDQLRSRMTPEQLEAQQKKITHRWRTNPKVIARESYGDRLLRLREEKLTKKPRKRARSLVSSGEQTLKSRAQVPHDHVHHVLYVTTVDTGEFYVGAHSTERLDDGYLGSGTKLTESVEKKGRPAHRRDIVEEFPDRQTLEQYKAEVINGVIDDPLCLNIRRGKQS
jgi:hypothetical protein